MSEGMGEHTALSGSSCMSVAASSVAVTNPVPPKSFLLSN